MYVNVVYLRVVYCSCMKLQSCTAVLFTSTLPNGAAGLLVLFTFIVAFFLLEATNESMSSTFMTFILYRIKLLILSQCLTSLWGQPLLHWATCKSAVFPFIGYLIGYTILCIQIQGPHERYVFFLALSTNIIP